jgi:hypothetical protein
MRAGYAVWGGLDSVNDIRISAENDQYGGTFAVFDHFRDDLNHSRIANRRCIHFK